MKPKVGLIGLGLMGLPMGRNLLKAGFPLVVWNRTRAKAEQLEKEGAKVANSPREVTAASDVTFTIVSDPPALEQVLWGEPGALAGLRQRKRADRFKHCVARSGATRFAGLCRARR